ncbi:MAG: heme-dependent oxidative N-demethylase subunit alpha family protein [Thermomicrobiales bacterium]
MVRDRFEVRADLFPLGAVYNGTLETEHFLLDERFPAEIAAKLDLLGRDAGRVNCIGTDDPAGLAESLWRTFALLARDCPAAVEMRPDGVALPLHGLALVAEGAAERVCPLVAAHNPSPLGARVHEWLKGRQGVARLLDAVALSCQEDVVVMRGGARSGAEALHVCFPSGWDPREKLGGTFAAIHAPIADSERLIKASPNVMRAMLSGGPFLRYAWGVTLNPHLDNHPAAPRPVWRPEWDDDPAQVARLAHLRMERQTTAAFPGLDRALFTIRVYVDPFLARLAADPSLRRRLRALMGTTAPAVLEYKGMTRIVPPLLRWLAETADGGDPATGDRKSPAEWTEVG